MNTFPALVYLEIKLILRSKLFWPLAILSILSIQIPMLTLLLCQFIFIYQFAQEERSHFTKIFHSLPYSTTTLYLSRAAAALLLLFSLWPFMLLNLAFFPELKPAAWLLMPKALLFLTAKYAVLAIIQVGLLFLFKTITKQLLWQHLLAIVTWTTTSYLASNVDFFPAYYRIFLLGQGIFLPNVPSLAAGYFPQSEIFPGFALFSVGLTLLFLLAAILRQMLSRQETLFSFPFLIILLLALTTGAFGSHAVFQELTHREYIFQGLLKNTPKAKTPAEITANFQMEAYQLDIKLATASHTLSGTAYITGKPAALPAAPLFFTLRDYLTVTSIIEATTKTPLPWRQEGSSLRVFLPPSLQKNPSITVAISYSGEVLEWFPDRMSRPNGPVNIVAAPYSLLRSSSAWYPIPGQFSLYTAYDYQNPITTKQNRALRTNKASHAALPFSLTVTTDTDDRVAANLPETAVENLSGKYKTRYHFASALGQDIFLAVGPYVHHFENTAAGKISVYTYPTHQQTSARVVQSLATLYTFYSDLLSTPPTPDQIAANKPTNHTLIEIPSFFNVSDDGSPLKDMTLHNTIALDENDFEIPVHTLDFLNTVQANKRDMAVLQACWPESLSDDLCTANWGETNIKKSLAYYLYILGLEKTRLPKIYVEAKQNILTGDAVLTEDFCMPSLLISPITREVFLTLDTVRSELGEQALRQLIRQLYHSYTVQNRLSAKVFTSTVNALIAASPLAAEKQAEIHENLLHIDQLAAAPGDIKPTMSLTIFAFNMEEFLP